MAIIRPFDALGVKNLCLIQKNSHKGDNGRVLVIGGSTLFHSASIWAAELLSHLVDLVFYFSPAHINEEILLRSKVRFRNGIIVPDNQLEHYISEADVILIGPGMCRQSKRQLANYSVPFSHILKEKNEGRLTYLFVNNLLSNHPHKKWVIDAGALQEVELSIIPETAIMTPHFGEFIRLFPSLQKQGWSDGIVDKAYACGISATKATWLLKHQDTDYIFSRSNETITTVSGGNEGLIKGGTGDLLAALVAALYVKNGSSMASSCASYILKQAAERLYEKRGPFYSTSDVMNTIPETAWSLLR